MSVSLMVPAAAVFQPFGWPEEVVVLPAATIVVAAGAVSVADASNEVRALAPAVGFLAAVLVLWQTCADEGLIEWRGAWVARVAGQQRQRLLLAAFAVAAFVTVVLSLDATVMLLTPVACAPLRG